VTSFIASLFVFPRGWGQGSSVASWLERISVPRRLEASAILVYATVFVLLVEYGRPGLGISQGFYLAIVLVALAGGPVSGVAAGVVATLLCVFAVLIHDGRVSSADYEPLAIRLAVFTLAGLAVGYFARRGRQMLAESLHVLDEVMRLARRETATGLLTAEGITDRINQRAHAAWPFAVLVGEVASTSDAALRDSLRVLANALDHDSEIGGVGRGRIAVVTSARTPDDARRLGGDAERALPGMLFGWAFFPQDGNEALALFGTASERLQARREDGGDVIELISARAWRSR
jgi:hypothetical protein